MKDGKPKTLEEALKIIEIQNRRLSEKDKIISENKIEIALLKEQIAIKRAREFLARSEKSSKILKDQPYLPFDIEFAKEEENQDTKNEVSKNEEENSTEVQIEEKEVSKSKTGRKSLDKKNNLPKRKIVIDLTAEEKICSNCGTEMKKVRQQVSERLVHVPSYEYIEVIVKNVYECPSCVNEDDTPVTKVAEEKRIIERSIATPELLSHVFMGKYQRHTPYYCQEECYNWQGVNISRQNMSNWQQKVYKALIPLENQFKKKLKKGKYLQMDETPLEVLKVDEDEVRSEYWDEERYRKKDENQDSRQPKQCYMWVVRGGIENHPVHLYNFRWTRSGKNVLEFLEGFSGNVIQSDGYSGYDSAVKFWNENHLEHQIVHANCNVHARRKFSDSVKATKSKTAKEAVAIYKEIFKAENELRDKFEQKQISEEEFLKLRQERVKPIFDKFYNWLLEKDSNEYLTSSETAKAIKYCLKHWENLTNYLNYSFLTPDTNAAERAVKPFVTARKNFLFSGSGLGARSSCFLFTLIETAKANGLNPEDYLRCVFEKAPYAKTETDWEALLPWNIEITPFKMRGEWVD